MFARWANEEELKERLKGIKLNESIEKSGIPIMYDDENLYIDDSEKHTLVIGGAGSSKKQNILYPQVKLSIKANESFIVNDIDADMYNVFEEEALNAGYNVIPLYLVKENGNKFNPLSLPYELYKKGDIDRALEVLDKVARYLVAADLKKSSDPFWENSAANYFIGVSLYLFENASIEEITIDNVYKVSMDSNMLEEYIKNEDKLSPVYINLSSILFAPKETKESIIAVFRQKLGLFVSRSSIVDLMNDTDFDLSSIQKEKTAIFIISTNNGFTSKLVPMIIDELCYSMSLYKNSERRMNILLDEFNSLGEIYDFDRLLVSSRFNNIRFTVCVRSLLELNNIYDKEESEIIKTNFGNIIYLYASDIETLEEISRLCGKANDKEDLISVEKLKLVKECEAIILMIRVYPIKTKLLPYYKMEW